MTQDQKSANSDIDDQSSATDMIDESVQDQTSKQNAVKEVKDEFALDDENMDKIEEYFKTKKVLKTLRGDLRDLKKNHDRAKELEELNKQVRFLRQEINNSEDIRIVSDKVAGLKERMDLLKEIIYSELKQSDEQEISLNGRKLKIVEVLKEMKDEE